MIYSIYVNGKYRGFTEDDDIESFVKEYYPKVAYEVKEYNLFIQEDIS